MTETGKTSYVINRIKNLQAIFSGYIMRSSPICICLVVAVRACMPQRTHELCWWGLRCLEGLTMPNRSWGSDQTKWCIQRRQQGQAVCQPNRRGRDLPGPETKTERVSDTSLMLHPGRPHD